MDYIDLKPPLGRLTEQQCKRVKDAIDIVHSNQLVFGDLRRSNILVGNDTAMLVDFDWCGKSGIARYPPKINCDPSMGWPHDVGPDCLMLHHDDYMLNRLTS